MENHQLTTESINPNTQAIDHLSTSEILTIMNQEDRHIPDAIEKVIPAITKVVDAVVKVIKGGGRVFLVGAGTSGRLGILEAAECPPTFGVEPTLFQGVIAGGHEAIFHAIENAEDDRTQGGRDLEARGLTDRDAVIGIAASGRTPYVIGALEWAKKKHATTIALACNERSIIGQIADYKIEAIPGPEVISGSTRMKAGSTQKIILNMITTTAMIKTGKVYRNLMVDLHISNHKLKERAINILQLATGTDREVAAKALEASESHVKEAIVMLKKNVDFEKAKQLLKAAGGYVREAIEEEEGLPPNDHLAKT